MRFFAIALFAGAIVCWATATRADVVNGLRVVVNASVITDYQVKVGSAAALELLARQYAGRPDEFRRRASEVVQNSLDGLVDRQLIVNEFNTSGFSLPDTIIEESIQDRIRDRYGDRMKLIKTLQAEGMTLERLRQQIRDQIIVDAMRARTLRGAVIISPYKVETYYREHQNDFKVEEQIKLSMIVLDSNASPTPEGRKQLGEEILTKLKEGASFSEMASIYSSGSQRKAGGDWGWAERSTLRKDLAEVAFSLPVAQPSAVVETPDECYIMLVTEVRPAHIKPIEDVRDEIDRTLQIEERARLEKRWIEKLKDKTFVRYF